MTSRPFGVNLTMLPNSNAPDYKAYAQAILDEGIRIVETAGLIKPVMPMLKEAGVTVLHKVGTGWNDRQR